MEEHLYYINENLLTKIIIIIIIIEPNKREKI